VDALLVAAPDDQHYAMAMAALEAGKHLLCEKPIALNATQAREIHEKAQAAGVIHLVMFTFRWTPEYQYLRELVEAGTIGRPYHCQVRYLSQWGRSGEYNWRYDRHRANGVLGDLGSHAIDLARLLVGEITRVSARLATYIDRSGPDGRALDPANDSAVLLLEFANGAQGTLQLSAVAHTSQLQTIDVELHGSAGSLKATLPWQQGAQLSAVRGGDQPVEHLPVPERLWCGVPITATYIERFTRLLQTAPVADRLFIDSILSGSLPQPNLFDGWKTQQVVDAALAANASGQWVAVG
jgi:predicted dehydrogenase